jgi:hypothetical protein
MLGDRFLSSVCEVFVDCSLYLDECWSDALSVVVERGLKAQPNLANPSYRTSHSVRVQRKVDFSTILFLFDLQPLAHVSRNGGFAVTVVIR